MFMLVRSSRSLTEISGLTVIYSELDAQDLVLTLMFSGLFETAAYAVAFQITPSLSEWQLRYKDSVTSNH